MNQQAPPSPFVSDVAPADSERIDLDSEAYSNETKARHIKRYAWAISKIQERFVRAGRIIDFACGTGYGSAMLASVAHEVYGRDKDESAIATAMERHSSTLVNFAVRDRIQRHEGDSTPFDAVVSIETIEHLDPASFGPDDFLEECRKLIIPNGLLVLSTPLVAPDGVLRSKFHLKEYSVDEINALVLAHGFAEIRHDEVLPGFICLTARRMP
jgi:2-polyprenyl-3-methyl-5-hydroxy-6-metoxy-1,4-benzoquinol methylase